MESTNANDCLPEFFGRVKHLTLQLSNLCNYAAMHKQRQGNNGCPVGSFTEKQILPGRIVRDVLDTAFRYGLGNIGIIRWHDFNEPLIDPRLMTFVQYVRQRAPAVAIQIWTNGWYLTKGLADELIDAGVTHFTISCYTPAEQERLDAIAQALKEKAVFTGTHGLTHLVARIMDTTEIVAERYVPCKAPFKDLTIRASGRIGLCCLEWQEEVTFGDLHRQSFAEAVQDNYADMLSLNAELGAGIRKHLVCRQCQRHR